MKKKKIVILLLIVILAISYLMDTFFLSKDLINDYYTYINKELFDNEEIALGEVGWSKFSLAQEKVDDEIEEIVKELVNSKSNSDINVLYNNYLNISSRDKVGLGVLDSYIKLIDNSKNINEFINNAIKVENDLYIDIFTLSTVAPDFKDTSKNIVYFYPVTFDFGMNSDIYINPDYSRYHALLKQAQIKLLKLYGYDKVKSREISGMLDEFFTNLASKSKNEKDLSDVDSLYNVITKNDLQNIYTNIDIDNYLKLMGISNQEYFSIVDIENYKAMNSYLIEDNLYLLKEYVKIKILEVYGGYTSSSYSSVINDLNNKLMGVESTDTIEDEAVSLISTVFSSVVDKIYLENNFSLEDKEFIEKMVYDILEYYQDNIESNTWMDSKTKDKAILKLKNMKINIGGNYDDLITYNFNSNSTLLDNILLINKMESDQLLIKLNNNDVESIISPTIVNAYYNPLDNSINFPASLKELYDSSDNYYSILGSMGMIIAHEITHAFDNNGSKFDEFGNRVDWWSDNDYFKFQELQEDIISYYSNYEVLGIEVDGEKTVGENIADLGAVNAIVSIANNKNASSDELKILFSSYASLWASEYIDSYQKSLLLIDTHSPDKVRVNAVLSSCDTFYEVYDISEDDSMYIDKSSRVGIW
ncbi:MAG: M13 family metallopeptidase [Bacilli bacterium]|nr:M13 family metallopeptidase [Bacilli bacterium]